MLENNIKQSKEDVEPCDISYSTQPYLEKIDCVEELKKGDIITLNNGYKSEVVEIIPSKTGKTITVRGIN